jgi:hypothetical protein
MSENLIGIKFNSRQKNIEKIKNFEEFKLNCLKKFNLPNHEIKNYIFYIVSNNKKINIESQNDYNYYIIEAQEKDIVYFKLKNRENEQTNNNNFIYPYIKNNDNEIMQFQNQMKELNLTLKNFEERLKKIEIESNNVKESERKSKDEFSEYKSLFENEYEKLNQEISEIYNKEIEEDEENEEEEEGVYYCKILFQEKYNFKLDDIEKKQSIEITLQIENQGKNNIPGDSLIMQNNEKESIFSLEPKKIVEEICPNFQINLKIVLKIKNNVNITPGNYPINVFIIHSKFGIISSKGITYINIE